VIFKEEEEEEEEEGGKKNMERCRESSRFLPWVLDLGSMCICLLRSESA
jgi:hypothetical protein